jgi:hypothetical protein
MKKKLTRMFLLSIYVLAVAAGYVYAKTSGIKTDAVNTPVSQQFNWVLVRVDDMTAESPRLVSVWVMLSSLSSGPQVFFKPIYSTEINNARSSELARKFAVNSDRTLSSQFLNELNRINISRSGLVILDDKGFQEFTTWFSALYNRRQTAGISSALWQPTAAGSETQSYQHICEVLQAQNQERHIDLRWKDLIPNHIELLPNLDPFASLWDQLLSSSTPANCKILSGQ